MKVLIAALLLVSPVAAFAQADPYDQAVAARLAGRSAEAVRLLEPLTETRGNDADLWLNLGLAYMAEGRLDEADRALARARNLAPGYQDVVQAQARLAAMRREPIEPQWRLDASGSYSRLSKGLESWRGAALYLGRRVEGGSVAAGVEYTRRFGREDLYLEAQAGRDFGAWNGFVAAGGTPDADYRPELAVRAGAQLAGAVFRPGLDVSWARYAAGDVKSLQPNITLERGPLVLAARWIATWDEFDEFRSGYALGGEWRVADAVLLRAGWADAPESSEGVTIDVQAVSLGVGFDLNDRTALRIDGVKEDRGAYDRSEIAVGVTRRF